MKAATTPTGSSPQFHFIGGKGGVGKTTCAAAFAIVAASKGLRVLVASTDPAPSLGDALNVPLSRSPKSLGSRFNRRGRGSLQAVEIDAAAVLRRWIDERRTALERIAIEGTFLDQEDVQRLLGLSLPGIDEVAGLLELSRLARTGRYDRIIVDTAPTGHTLRMLATPEILFGVARVFEAMREKHRTVVEALRGAWSPAREDLLIQDMAQQSRDLTSLLTDPDRTRVSWVTLAEPMAVAETIDALDHLGARGVPLTEIVVNRLTPPAAAARCGHCTARRALETTALRNLPRVPRVFVTTRTAEPRGAAALSAIGRELQRRSSPSVRSLRREPRERAPVKWTADVSGVQAPPGALVGSDTRLVLFGGKGGVGKTTCAAALAIACAQRWPDRSVQLISTDPAHSLADVLGVPLGDRASGIRGAPPNLLGREMDAAQVFARIRTSYATAIDRVFDRIRAGSLDVVHDRAVIRTLIDLAPPGLDELAAVAEITDRVSTASQELTVVDMAPTGHALRLLEMPELIHGWTKALMAILLKYQSVARLGELASLLLDLSKKLGRLRVVLCDPRRTRFILVTRPGVLPRYESERLIRRLRALRIGVPVVLVNAVGRGVCSRCRRSASIERREIQALAAAVRRSRAAVALVLTTTVVPPPRSAAALSNWQRSGWRYHQDP